MPSYPLFILEFVLCTNSSLFWFRIANELCEFRNYLLWYKKSGAHAWNSTGHAPRKQRSTTTKDNIPLKAKAVKWIFSGGISLCVTN